MVAATRHSVPGRGAAVGFAGLLAAVVLLSGRAQAEPPAREDGLFISIRNPITSDVVDNVQAKTKRALERTDRRIRTFIFDFNPGEHAEGHPSGTRIRPLSRSGSLPSQASRGENRRLRAQRSHRPHRAAGPGLHRHHHVFRGQVG